MKTCEYYSAQTIPAAATLDGRIERTEGKGWLWTDGIETESCQLVLFLNTTMGLTNHKDYCGVVEFV